MMDAATHVERTPCPVAKATSCRSKRRGDVERVVTFDGPRIDAVAEGGRSPQPEEPQNVQRSFGPTKNSIARDRVIDEANSAKETA